MAMALREFTRLFYLHGRPRASCNFSKWRCSSSVAAPEDGQQQQEIQFYLKTTNIPEDLDNAVRSYLEKSNKKSTINDGLKLARYLRNRGRPVLTKPPSKATNEADHSQAESGQYGSSQISSSPFEDDGLQEMEDLSNLKADRRASKIHRQRQLLRQYNVIRYGPREATAFAASRIPSCYGSALRVFNEIHQREPDFAPKTILDFGSGAGTAYWAAKTMWQDAVKEYQFVDPSDDMLNLSEELIRKSKRLRDPLLPGVYFRKFLPMTKMTYNVVIAAYTLSELPFASQRRQLIEQLWEKTNDFLVIIEQGNNEGFEINLQARNMLVKKSKGGDVPDDRLHEQEEASIFSPCPHDNVCARTDRGSRDHPCNFEQRVGLSYAQEQTSLKRFGYATERFSYIVLKKGLTEDLSHPRLLRPVKKRKGHIVCDLCCKNGNIEQHVLTKTKHADLYKRTRHKLNWGDMLPIDTTVGKAVRVIEPPKMDKQTEAQGFSD